MNSVTISVDEYNRLRDEHREMKKNTPGFYVIYNNYSSNSRGDSIFNSYSSQNEEGKRLIEEIKEEQRIRAESTFIKKFEEWKKEWEENNKPKKKKTMWFFNN